MSIGRVIAIFVTFGRIWVQKGIEGRETRLGVGENQGPKGFGSLFKSAYSGRLDHGFQTAWGADIPTLRRTFSVLYGIKKYRRELQIAIPLSSMRVDQ